MPDTIKNLGYITQIIGPVLDVTFPSGNLPKIYNAIIIKNVNEQAHIDITRYKFVKSLIEQIDYVMNSLLFQPDKNIIFDCIIKYLDEFIKQFDTLYSPSHSQRYQFSNLQDPMHLPPGMRYFDDPSELTYIFDKKIAYSLLISTLAIIISEYINNQN